VINNLSQMKLPKPSHAEGLKTNKQGKTDPFHTENDQAVLRHPVSCKDYLAGGQRRGSAEGNHS